MAIASYTSELHSVGGAQPGILCNVEDGDYFAPSLLAMASRESPVGNTWGSNRSYGEGNNERSEDACLSDATNGSCESIERNMLQTNMRISPVQHGVLASDQFPRDTWMPGQSSLTMDKQQTEARRRSLTEELSMSCQLEGCTVTKIVPQVNDGSSECANDKFIQVRTASRNPLSPQGRDHQEGDKQHLKHTSLPQLDGPREGSHSNKKRNSRSYDDHEVQVKKRMKNQRHFGVPPFGLEIAQLEACFSERRRTYETLGLPDPENFLDSVATKQRLRDLGISQYDGVLKIFTFFLGNYETLVGIQDVLQAYRSNDRVPFQNACYMSNQQRLDMIQALGAKAAYHDLLKKYHIHKLYTDNADPLRNPSDNFVITYSNNVIHGAKAQMGNPRHTAEAEITKSILQEVCPNLSVESENYSAKYREITALRRSGRRLDALVSKFGIGILGMIPLAQDNTSTGLVFRVTDSMYVAKILIIVSSPMNNQAKLVIHRISHLSDEKFRGVLTVLDEYEGHLLRAISKPVGRILQEIVQGTLHSSISFPIEDIERGQLIQYAKGAPKTLRLFSEVGSSTSTSAS